MASTEYKFPKFKKSLWCKAIDFIAWLGLGDFKWTEFIINWLIRHKKPVGKLGKDYIYFEDLK